MGHNIDHLDTGNFAACRIVSGLIPKVDLSCSIRRISVAEQTCSIFREVFSCCSKVISPTSSRTDEDMCCSRVSPGSK